MSEYLAIKNWDKFQTATQSRIWIKDYVQKESDPDIGKLTLFQRGLLDGCCRLRGRQGKNLRNDHTWIARALCVMPTDRPHISHAIDTLIAHGFLILTDEQDSPPRIEKMREDERREEKPSVRVSHPEQSKPESVFGKAYDCYPRHEARRAAEKAWGQAINREAAKCVRTNAEHEDFIYQKVMQYGAACRRYHKEKKYTPHMATWLNQDRFLDDPSEWEVTGNGRGNSKAEQRVADVAATTQAVFNGCGPISGDAATGLPNPATSRGAGDLAGNAQKLLARGVSAGGGSSGR